MGDAGARSVELTQEPEVAMELVVEKLDWEKIGQVPSKDLEGPLPKQAKLSLSVENQLSEKTTIWICPISWIRVDVTHTQLSITFFHEIRPHRPIYKK